jgi:hypothetical protein
LFLWEDINMVILIIILMRTEPNFDS